MEDGEGGLSFDFEGGLDPGTTQSTAPASDVQSSTVPTAASGAVANATNNQAASAPAAQAADGTSEGRRNFRQTVCRHWLRSLCMKGDACGFLHQYDKARMPVCRFFRLYGECRQKDCMYKHTIDDIKECNMYKLGFCPNGPDCRYRHAKLPGPPPPVEEVLQKIQHFTSHNYGNPNRLFQNRNTNNAHQTEKSQFSRGPNGANQVGKTITTDSANVHQQQQQQGQQSQQQGSQGQIQNLSNGQQNPASRAIPLPQGSSRYFIVKSCNRDNLELYVQQGVWATQQSNESKLNEAFDSVENVIIIFSINKTRHFQGCAKMTSRNGGSIGEGNWKHEHGSAHYGRNFAVKWSKLCELSVHKTLHLRNPYNENLPVEISRDCQELEPSVGEQLAFLLYLEPDSDLMATSLAAESKREEEKAKGINPENPAIAPFKDNVEEEEEESDEEESCGQVFRAGAQGRGRGRGIMCPPHMPFAHGARPFPGMRGFPGNMMAGDGFPMPDPISMASCAFGPYGPRFLGDFPGPVSGMMFRGKPSGGFGMMTGQGRPPFMGGMVVGAPAAARPGRPVGMPPFFPPSQPSQNSNWAKRDYKVPANERFSSSSDQGKGQETTGSLGRPDDNVQYQQRVKSRPDDH